jgi:hypothetical protein
MKNRPVQWIPRTHALTPIAVAASGATAQKLLQRVQEFNDERLRVLRGVAFENTVVLTGCEEDLPWIEGVLYLGRDPAAPHLLIPTNLSPDVPLSLLDEAIFKRSLREPLALLPGEKLVIPLDGERELSRESILGWLARSF